MVMLLVIAFSVRGFLKGDGLPIFSGLRRGGELEVAGLFGDSEIQIHDSILGDAIVYALRDVEINKYDSSCFKPDKGFIIYDSDQTKTYQGIDVSAYQKDIDWQKVKASGIDYAMIRLGYRGYTEGGILVDEMFEKNIKGANAAGVDVGIYFFSQATNVWEAMEEAKVVLSHIKDYKITYPVVFDWENIVTDKARTDNVTTKTLNECCVAFCEAVKVAGYTPMVYFSKKLALLQYDLSNIDDYDFWVADYSAVPTFYYNFQMWQYSSNGTIDGIDGNTDLNLCFVDYAKNSTSET